MSEASPKAVRIALLQQILELARKQSPQALSATDAARLDAPLYARARSTFGSWELALASALVEALTQRSATPRMPTGFERRPLTPRQRQPEATRPLFALGAGGCLVQLAGDAIATSETPARPLPPRGWPAHLELARGIADLPGARHVLAASSDGRLFFLRGDDIPSLSSVPEPGLSRVVGVAFWVGLHDAEQPGSKPLFVTVTEQGHLALTYSAALAWEAIQNGVTEFSTDPDDASVSTWFAERGDRLVVVSSSGRVLAVDLGELEVGSRACDVHPALRPGRSPPASSGKETIIGTVLASQGLELALVTRRGLAKRVPLEAFRSPKATAVHHALRLDLGDAVVAVTACGPSSDVVATTTRGRMLRVPALVLPLLPCATRAEPLVELDPGEEVVSLDQIAPQPFARHAPLAFEI